MSVTVNSDFRTRAREVVRDFVRSAVMIDDQWPETHAADLSEIDDALVHNAPNVIALDGTSEISALGHADASAGPAPVNEELRKVEKSFVDEGVPFCGQRYTRARHDKLLKLLLRSDIAVLDWNLTSTDAGVVALQLLAGIAADTTGPRIVVIFTGQRQALDVKKAIVEKFRSIQKDWPATNTDNDLPDFRVGPFVVLIRNKAGGAIDSHNGEAAVFPADLASVAIDAMCQELTGLLSLSLLELTNQHRGKLSRVLHRFNDRLDAALVIEWADKASPVDFGGALRQLLLDEWRAEMESTSWGAGSRSKPAAFRVMSDDGVSAFLADRTIAVGVLLADILEKAKKYKNDTTAIAGLRNRLLKEFRPVIKLIKATSPTCANEITATLSDGAKLEANLNQLTKFRAAPNKFGGKLLGIDSKSQEARNCFLTLRSAILSHWLSGSSTHESLLELQTLFSQQTVPATGVTQGTVLQFCTNTGLPHRRLKKPMKPFTEEYLICITPLCDAARPNKIDDIFSFVRARAIRAKDAPNAGFSADDGTKLMLRTEVGNVIALEIAHKPPVSAKVPPNAQKILGLPFVIEPWPVGKAKLTVKIVAQLRQEHASLVTASVGAGAARVGVNNLEYFRTFLGHRGI